MSICLTAVHVWERSGGKLVNVAVARSGSFASLAAAEEWAREQGEYVPDDYYTVRAQEPACIVVVRE